MIKELLVKFAVDESGKYDEIKGHIKDRVPNANASDFSATNIINYLLYAGGIAAVVMIIVAGLQMSASAGDAGALAKAKRTMIWAIGGLVVMVLAYAIVNFVIGKL